MEKVTKLDAEAATPFVGEALRQLRTYIGNEVRALVLRVCVLVHVCVGRRGAGMGRARTARDSCTKSACQLAASSATS